MTAEENKTIALRTYEIVSSGNLDALDEIMDPDFIDHHPQPQQGPGLEGLKRQFSELLDSFPDVQWTAEDAVAEGDKVATRTTIHGTHQRNYRGIPATGKQISVPIVDIVRIVDGRIVERWGVEDQFSLLQQLGGAASSKLASLGRTMLVFALPVALFWAWRNDKLPWS